MTKNSVFQIAPIMGEHKVELEWGPAQPNLFINPYKKITFSIKSKNISIVICIKSNLFIDFL